MTDPELDLVEELRLLAELADHSELGLVMISGRSFSDAADEIEMLRDRNDRTEQDRNESESAPVPEYRNDRSDEQDR